MTQARRALILMGIGLCATQAAALDWPQWRGPQRDGISQETGLLKAWPKEGPKLVWQVDTLGFGYSTPAVSGDRSTTNSFPSGSITAVKSSLSYGVM